MIAWIEQSLALWNISQTVIPWLSHLVYVVFIILLAWMSDLVAKRYIVKLIGYFVKKTPTLWDDYFLQNKVFDRLSQIVPALVIYFGAFTYSGYVLLWVQKFTFVYIVFVLALVIDAALNTVDEIYQNYPVSKDKPIKSYLQVVKLVIFAVFGILIVAHIIDRSPWGILSGIGAISAILLLIFKDAILGFVTSIQLSTGDIIRVGDWITIPSKSVDGDVMEISLNVVKIRNFDKTVVTLPTYELLSQSVQNWRGMSESGGRRIKRALCIDVNTIRFCDQGMLQRFQKIDLLKGYLKDKEQEIAAYNQDRSIQENLYTNGRCLTNVGTFRAYIVAYLKQHPKIHQSMTLLVRHLAPTPQGLPIELYVFTNDTDWGTYESIQADIFDHLLAAVDEFDLKVFQDPTGSDFSSLKA